MTETYAEARQIISAAITALTKAEESASGSQQLVLLPIISDLRRERRAIDVNGLRRSNQTYRALTDDIDEAKKQLDALNDEIRSIVDSAERAAEVAGALTKLVQLGGGLTVP